MKAEVQKSLGRVHVGRDEEHALQPLGIDDHLWPVLRGDVLKSPIALLLKVDGEIVLNEIEPSIVEEELFERPALAGRYDLARSDAATERNRGKRSGDAR